MNDKISLFITTSLITFGAIGNLIRLYWNISASIGFCVLPGWTGAILFLGLGLLAAWSFRELAAYHPPSNASNH